MAWREGPRLRPLDDDRPDRCPVGPQHRYAEHATEVNFGGHLGVVRDIVADVVDRRDGAVEDSAAGDLRARRGHRVRTLESRQGPGRYAVMRDQVELLALEAIQGRGLGAR